MFTESPRARSAVAWTAVFVMPVIAVQLTGWFVGSSGAPALAAASPAAPDTAIEASTALINVSASLRQRIDDIDRATLKQIEQLRSEQFGPTPMLHTIPPKQTNINEPNPGETFQVQSRIDPLPNVTLQAIMSGNESARALINNHLHEIGETIGQTDWVIININADTRRVALEHRVTGRIAAIILETP